MPRPKKPVKTMPAREHVVVPTGGEILLPVCGITMPPIPRHKLANFLAHVVREHGPDTIVFGQGALGHLVELSKPQAKKRAGSKPACKFGRIGVRQRYMAYEVVRLETRLRRIHRLAPEHAHAVAVAEVADAYDMTGKTVGDVLKLSVYHR